MKLNNTSRRNLLLLEFEAPYEASSYYYTFFTIFLNQQRTQRTSVRNVFFYFVV